MFIIGTTGHIDHGKSALVRALTSMDPDRLPEEKRRGMTIDLGFAWLPLSSGQVIGIVDVPGHKDLIKNVIAGVWGIDATLLVVAADDGWMPQTEEHLRLLDIFHIEHGIVALTKVDLIDDPDWLNLVEDDIKEKLKRTRLFGAPIIRVSAKEQTNIRELRSAIEVLISKIVPKRDVGRPYLPIDRSFTIQGSGTVVTGILIDGSLSIGEKVVIYPKNLHTRIRALESYKKKLDRAQSGIRAAVNLVGCEKNDLRRGDIVFGGEGQIRSSKTINTRVELASQLAYPLKDNTELAVFLGTREIIGRMILLGRKKLRPGESEFAQFRFNEPVATRIGDRFALRKPSPPETIGGGTVLDPLATKHKTKDMGQIILFLQRRSDLAIEGLILSELDKNKYAKVDELLFSSHYSLAEVTNCVKSLQNINKLIVIHPWVVDFEHWQKQLEVVQVSLAAYHLLHPLRKGLAQAELQNRLNLPKPLFNRLITSMIESRKIICETEAIALYTHKPFLSPKQELVASTIMGLFETNKLNPPTKSEIAIQIPGSEDIIGFMCQQNMLIDINNRIIVNERMETEIPYILAVGDIRSGSPNQIITAAGDGATAAIAAERLLQKIE
ncbi:selenocysteine-specific translation elongation factor [Chloroflexota bacterium]